MKNIKSERLDKEGGQRRKEATCCGGGSAPKKCNEDMLFLLLFFFFFGWRNDALNATQSLSKPQKKKIVARTTAAGLFGADAAAASIIPLHHSPDRSRDTSIN